MSTLTRKHSAGKPFARRLATVLMSLITMVILTTYTIGCALSGPGYQGPVSEHFDGERFINQEPIQHRSFGEFLQWMWDREPGPWPEQSPTPPGPPPPREIGHGKLRVTYINHATVLVQMDGLNILTDPIWSERASPFSWIGPRRFTPPGIRFEDLPPIDVVILSHNHYDHFDTPTLTRLEQTHQPLFVAGLGNGSLLADADLDPQRIRELDWWQDLPLSGEVRLYSVPAQHFSGRGLWDRDATLWTGYVLQGPAGTVYFAGDTGFGPHFAQVRERFGPPRLALLPIGAFRPQWFMARVHLSPREAVLAHDILGARASIPIHYGTFRLADDGQNEPLEALEKAIDEHNSPKPRFLVLNLGEGRDIP